MQHQVKIGQIREKSPVLKIKKVAEHAGRLLLLQELKA